MLFIVLAVKSISFFALSRYNDFNLETKSKFFWAVRMITKVNSRFKNMKEKFMVCKAKKRYLKLDYRQKRILQEWRTARNKDNLCSSIC